MREHGIERMVRDARINRIVEGATEVMTAFVALAGMKGVGEEFEAVLRASRHPVGNFGRLAKFARTQWTDVVTGGSASAGRNGHIPAELRREGRMLAKLTTRFARAITRVLAKYQQDILDMQLIQRRIATAAVNLYAMAAVISRLQSTLADPTRSKESVKHDLLLGKRFCRRAAQEVVDNLRTLSRNQDKELLEVADAVLGPLG
jgi:alkylation response protein AidB-like acyl-CoA dehydrogenase